MHPWKIACALALAPLLMGAAQERVVVTSEDLVCALEEAVAAGPPGVTAAIATSDGVIWSGAAGHADLQTLTPAGNDHLFGIGSITKPFVTIVTLQLIEEGTLKLTDTPALILGEAVEGVPNADLADISQLLNHTSGIPSFEDDPKWIREGRGDGLKVDHIWGKTEALAYITGETHEPLFPPGENFSYSNTNFTLLGMMIEKVTGNDFVMEFENRIRKPLGISSIYLEGFEPIPQGRLSRRYHYSTKAFKRDAGINAAFEQVTDKLIDASASNLSSEWTDGGMVATSQNLAKFALAVRDGRLLNADSQKYLLEWRLAIEGDYPMWVGHGLFRETRLPGIMIGHSGSVLGYTGYMGWHEDVDLIVVALTNAGTMHVGERVMSASGVAQSEKFNRLARAYAREGRFGKTTAGDEIVGDLCGAE